MGIETDSKIVMRDSYFLSVTDPMVFLEYCLYPMYLSGDTDVKDRMERALLELSKSDDVLELYQIMNFIVTQDLLEGRYENIPFVIDFSDILNSLFKIKVASHNE